MTINPCKNFFSTLRVEKKSLGPDFHKVPQVEALQWEQMPASAHSIHPVIDNSEKLIRQFIDPVHIDQVNGRLAPGAFSDLETIGLSSNRIKYTSLEDQAEFGKQRVADWNARNPEKPSRAFVCFLSLEVAHLRGETSEINGKSFKVFAIYDTANEDDPSHADIMRLGGNGEPLAEKQLKSAAKRYLFDIAKTGLLRLDGSPMELDELAKCLS